MEINEFEEWIKELKIKTPQFLKKMRSKNSGFYRFSFSGDLYPEYVKWGLGNSIYSLKVYASLNIQPSKKSNIFEFIKSFEQKDGFFRDRLISIFSFPLRFIYSIRNNDFLNLNNNQNMVAETRQAISILKFYGQYSNSFYPNYFPRSKEGIKNYIFGLDWNKPWRAGSHFSHLIFFLSISKLRDSVDLITYAFHCINKIQNSNDGCWYTGNVSNSEKINGVMKILTAYRAANLYLDFPIKVKYSKKIIDFALKVKNDKHACDNFNITFVLCTLGKVTKNYKEDLIKKFMLERLDIYKKFYYSSYGGFSFNEKKSGYFYYSAPVTRGKNEPDVHGTAMYIWGITVIANYFNLLKKYDLTEVVV